MRRPPNKDYSQQRLILGTHTSESEQNYLMIAEVRLPLEDTEIDARKYDEERGGKTQHPSAGIGSRCATFSARCLSMQTATR